MPPRSLEPLLVGPGPAALDALPALRRALRGDGPPRLVLPPGAGTTTAAALGDGEDDPDDPTVLAVETSGSSGTPKTVLLPRSALLASAGATAERLGGPAAWLLALPPWTVAGLQVLVRSLQAGTTPVAVAPGAAGGPEALAAAARELDGDRRCTSLVPTQLHRLLAVGRAGAAALLQFDAVLVGGARASEGLVERARDAGVQAVVTYGSSETCGGCVYDGQPLAGVGVRVDAVDGRVRVSGPVLARGYLGRPDLTAAAFGPGPDGRRELRTDDLGERRPDGTLVVHGRVDDALLTGGVVVAPAAVEAALEAHPAVAEAVAVGLPDAEWGELVAAVVVPAPGTALPPLADLRAHVAARLGPPAAPRRVLAVRALPLRGPGKPDRAAVRALLLDPSRGQPG